MLALRRLMTALLLPICLALLRKPLGMVLCFGADGHIAFEPVHTQAHSTASLGVQGLLYQEEEALGFSYASAVDPPSGAVRLAKDRSCHLCEHGLMENPTPRDRLTSPLRTPEERLKHWQRFEGMWKDRTPDQVAELEKGF